MEILEEIYFWQLSAAIFVPLALMYFLFRSINRKNKAKKETPGNNPSRKGDGEMGKQEL